ncbi:MAG TPA: hypothetical protein VKD47_10255 [Miltoncostaeaceae bacterium]|nr:hypothetical protein [Miltoncostaeaceae bacterium]
MKPSRRTLAAGAAALAAAGLAAAPAFAADTNVSVTVNETLAITASTASVDFGAVAEGANPSSPASVTVKSNHVGGYQLAVSRTAFTNGDIPLTFAPGATPSGAVADAAADTAIPTAGSLNIGHRAAGANEITPSLGDAWSFNLKLGPVPFVRAGAHSSTVTFTVVGL